MARKNRQCFWPLCSTACGVDRERREETEEGAGKTEETIRASMEAAFTLYTPAIIAAYPLYNTNFVSSQSHNTALSTDPDINTCSLRT